MKPPSVPHADEVSAAVRGCVDSCRRCVSLIDRVDELESDPQAYGAIGPHLRHCVDHFDCLFGGLESGVVDYDARPRRQVLEVDPQRMREALASIVERLETLDRAGLGHSLHVRQSADPGGVPLSVESNLERELIFLSGHTIHHIAIMALIASSRGVTIPDDLGMAYSTAAHLDSVNTESRHA